MRFSLLKRYLAKSGLCTDMMEDTHSRALLRAGKSARHGWRNRKKKPFATRYYRPYRKGAIFLGSVFGAKKKLN